MTQLHGPSITGGIRRVHRFLPCRVDMSTSSLSQISFIPSGHNLFTALRHTGQSHRPTILNADSSLAVDQVGFFDISRAQRRICIYRDTSRYNSAHAVVGLLARTFPLGGIKKKRKLLVCTWLCVTVAKTLAPDVAGLVTSCANPPQSLDSLVERDLQGQGIVSPVMELRVVLIELCGNSESQGSLWKTEGTGEAREGRKLAAHLGALTFEAAARWPPRPPASPDATCRLPLRSPPLSLPS